MKEFLLNMNTSIFVFKIFNIFHIISILVVLLFSILIIYNKKRLLSISNINKKRIRIIFGIILVIFYFLRRGSFLYYGVYDWRIHLSLGFCNMNNLLFIIYCFTGSKRIYNICYYCAFCGPLISILFPVIDVGMNNFSFFNFLMIHHVIFIINIIFLIFERKGYSKNELIRVNVFVIIYVIISYIFNLIFHTRYNILDGFLMCPLNSSHIVQAIANNYITSLIIVLSAIMILIRLGSYILKLLNLGDGKNEKEVI